MAFNHNMVHKNIVRFPNAIDGSVGPTNVNVNGTLGIMQILMLPFLNFVIYELHLKIKQWTKSNCKCIIFRAWSVVTLKGATNGKVKIL